MRFPGRAVAIGILALALAPSAHAAPAHAAPAPRESGVVAMTALKRPLRTAIRLDDAPMRPAAWNRFVAAAGGSWHATWDHATAVPSRIFGSGIAAPGASADPDVAARAAREVIAHHLDLLAPGASIDDFELVSNHSDGDLRSIGFVQRWRGVRVIGGQVSVRIKADRIFVLSSQALPAVGAATGVQSALRARPLAAAELTTRARAAVERAVGLPATATAGAPGEAAILPLVTDDGVAGYRVVVPVTIDAGATGKWTTFVDPRTGAAVARRQELAFDVSVGQVQYDAVSRWNGGAAPRRTYAANGAFVTVDGVATTATATGSIIWQTAVAAAVGTGVTGNQAIVSDAGDLPLATGTISVPPSGAGVWSVAGDEKTDAQLNAFIHAGIVREFARATFAFDLDFLTLPVRARVNIADRCNAYSDGTTINFFVSSDDCENTARIADVVYHEYGHSIHRHAIIDGIGAFDGAMSEGLSDFLAASITGDPGMGRGFFKTDDPLRHIDPEGEENMWPRDIGEVHFTGLIFAGTFWDLRKRLIADLGETAGIALTLRLYYAAIQRSTDIPSSLIEALAADDIDGNLTNGTPHECAIRDIWGAHGMRTLFGTVDAPGAVVATEALVAAPVQIRISGLSSDCPGDEITRVSVGWRPGVGATPTPGAMDATETGDVYSASVPLPSDGGRVDFQAQIDFSDGSHELLPNNPADAYYQVYQGETVPLYCTDFETDPFAEGWANTESGVVNFEWGVPTRQFSATDPDAPYDGERILGLGLGADYADETSVTVALPPIDVGQYSDVLLQYRRWLTVEDNFFDHAEIRTNGAVAWANYNSNVGNSSSTHHIDREWRFHSVGLSTRFAGPILDLAFHLDSDQGLHFGGWSVDALCVVANPNSICGDGARSATEECDDGAANADAPDACRTNCKIAACGDGILDEGEECEPTLDTACLPACIIDPDRADGGCCSAGADPTGGLILSLGVGLLVLGRRRRRA